VEPYGKLSNDEIIDLLIEKPAPNKSGLSRSTHSGASLLAAGSERSQDATVGIKEGAANPTRVLNPLLIQSAWSGAVPNAKGTKTRHRSARARCEDQRDRIVTCMSGYAHDTRPSSDVFMACEDNISFMNSLLSGSMHLIVTSPPYNIGKTYEIRSSLDAYVRAQIPVIDECVRLLHPQGSLCWQVGNHVQKREIFPLDIVLYPIFRDRGLKLRNRVVWHFEHGLHCSKRLSGRYETILWFTKTDDYVFNLDSVRVPSKYPSKKYFKGPKAGQLSCNPLGKNPSDVWIFPNVKNNHVEKTVHPCQFPVELVERLVLALTNPGQKVFDPYMGVGTTVVAAVKHGRTGYGCDNVSDYVSIAWRRVRELEAGILKTRPMDRPVYDPTKPYGGHKSPNSTLSLSHLSIGSNEDRHLLFSSKRIRISARS
jgi:adenine-specific DNA-methyltransferase